MTLFDLNQHDISPASFRRGAGLLIAAAALAGADLHAEISGPEQATADFAFTLTWSHATETTKLEDLSNNSVRRPAGLGGARARPPGVWDLGVGRAGARGAVRPRGSAPAGDPGAHRRPREPVGRRPLVGAHRGRDVDDVATERGCAPVRRGIYFLFPLNWIVFLLFGLAAALGRKFIRPRVWRTVGFVALAVLTLTPVKVPTLVGAPYLPHAFVQGYDFDPHYYFREPGFATAAAIATALLAWLLLRLLRRIRRGETGSAAK